MPGAQQSSSSSGRDRLAGPGRVRDAVRVRVSMRLADPTSIEGCAPGPRRSAPVLDCRQCADGLDDRLSRWRIVHRDGSERRHLVVVRLGGRLGSHLAGCLRTSPGCAHCGSCWSDSSLERRTGAAMMAASPGPTVIQVVLSLSPGGTERLVVELARRLQPSFGMAVCCLDSPGSWAHLLTDRGIPVIALNRRPGFRPLLGRAIAQFAADRRATVMHCHHYSPFVYGSLARLWLRSGMVFTEHGRLNDDRPSNRRKLANRLFDRLPARIFAVSSNLRTFMIEEGFSQEHVDVIRNGIDLGPPPTAGSRVDARSRLGISHDEFVIGAIGRLDPVKSLETLIDAMPLMTRGGRRARLVLIGEGPERKRLEARVAAAGALDVVNFTSHRSDVRELP